MFFISVVWVMFYFVVMYWVFPPIATVYMGQGADYMV